MLLFCVACEDIDEGLVRLTLLSALRDGMRFGVHYPRQSRGLVGGRKLLAATQLTNTRSPLLSGLSNRDTGVCGRSFGERPQP